MKHLAFVLAIAITTPTTVFAQTQQTATVYNAIVSCAPRIDRGIVVGILQRESSTSPWQQLDPTSTSLWRINDNTERRSYTFPTYLSAVRSTEQRVNLQHHTVAIGMSQILSTNLPRLRVSIADAFLPCTNLSLAQNVLSWAYRLATDTYHIPPGLDATHIALQLYYAGKNDYTKPDAIEYANDVMNRAASFNARANAPAPTTIANLPMPDRPWPTGATAIPYQPPPPEHTSLPHPADRTPNARANAAATAYRARLQARASADQRRLNSYFQDDNNQ